MTFTKVVAMTAIAYLMVDLTPVQSLPIFKNIEVRIISALWQALVWMSYSILLTFIVYYDLGKSFGLTDLRFFSFLKQNFLEYLTAQIRVLISTSLWFLVFIIPGFVMDARYRLTPLIVFFYPDFHTNRKLDPLKISLEKIDKGKLGFISLLILLSFVAPFVLDIVYQHAHFNYEPQGRFAQFFIYSLLNLFTYSYVFMTYFELMEEEYV